MLEFLKVWLDIFISDVGNLKLVRVVLVIFLKLVFLVFVLGLILLKVLRFEEGLLRWFWVCNMLVVVLLCYD